MLKTVRFVKLFRVLRAARLINSIGSKSILHSSARVKSLVTVFQFGGLAWFIISGLLLPSITSSSSLGDRILMFGMFLTIAGFIFAMLIICNDVKKMLKEVLASTLNDKDIFLQADLKRKLTLDGILLIGPLAAIFTLLLSVWPVFEPDGSFWFILCACLAVLWNMLIFAVYYRAKIKSIFWVTGGEKVQPG